MLLKKKCEINFRSKLLIISRMEKQSFIQKIFSEISLEVK